MAIIDLDRGPMAIASLTDPTIGDVVDTATLVGGLRDELDRLTGR